MPNFTTGTASLEDVGTLSYNGCTFSSLFATEVSGVAVKDAANRTTKFVEYTLTVDGYATQVDGKKDTTDVMRSLRRLLSAQGGELVYQGRGNDFVVNRPGRALKDVAWGPVPEVLDFQPMGGGRSAKVKWTVKFRLPEIDRRGGPLDVFMLQYSEQTTVSYDEAGFSTLSIKGSLEIPLTRATQDTRTLPYTADNFRLSRMNRLRDGIDLRKFRITKRDFTVSRDKRTLEWDFVAEELPFMSLPPNVTLARGTFNIRPTKVGLGLSNWLITMRCTYTVAKNEDRNIAWLAFLALLRRRIRQSLFIGPGGPPPPAPRPELRDFGPLNIGARVLWGWMMTPAPPGLEENRRKAWLVDFSVDEGLYLDSKTTTFSATWRLVTSFRNILVQSGLWKQVDDVNGPGLWRTSVRPISGGQSWLPNLLDPSLDVIVDFGGGQ